MIESVKFDSRDGLVCKIGSLLGWCLLAACLVPSLVHAQANLLANSDLTLGSGDSPQSWRTDSLTMPPGYVTFEWLKDQQPPELEIWNYEPWDSRWSQSLHLKPGWYHFTASVRTENVGELDTGANISIMETWFASRNVRGTSYWEPIGFYLKVTYETDVAFACRLGFYSSQNTGRAYFRNLSVTPVAAPGADDPSGTLVPSSRPSPTPKQP
jgi:hypothetical protein